MTNQSLTDELGRLKQRNKPDNLRMLGEIELRFQCLLEVLPAAVYTCDAQGLITYFNHKAESIWGVSPRLGDPDKRFCGSFRLHLPDGSSLPHDKTPMARALSENRGFCNREVIIERPDGSRVSVLVNIDPIRDENGKVTGAVNAFSDITERKRIEEALREAKEVAEKANRAKDEFIAALSHELRTPLTPALITATFMEQDQTLDPGVRDQFGVIRNNIELEARLIDDLLDLTKIAHGKLCLRCERANIHDLLARSLVTVREDVLQKQLKVEVDMAADFAVAQVDSTRLLQVFWNLLRNAVKFTPAGGTLFVRTHNLEPHSLGIEFRDTGVGIRPEDIERIFLPFEQVADGDHRVGGVGLGLAISKSIVALHGGSISAASAGFVWRQLKLTSDDN